MKQSPGLQRPPALKKLMAEYGVNVPNTYEAIWQPLYDYQVAAATAPESQSFFLEPRGTNNKSANDTNMKLAGQIPAGQRFMITGVEIDFTPGSAIATAAVANPFLDDVWDFYRQGNLVINIGDKPWLTQGPLMAFPTSYRLGGFAATESTVADTSDNYTYATAAGREFQVRGLMLESGQDFSVVIQNRLDLPSTTAGRVGVRLNGWLFRNAQ